MKRNAKSKTASTTKKARKTKAAAKPRTRARRNARRKGTAPIAKHSAKPVVSRQTTESVLDKIGRLTIDVGGRAIQAGKKVLEIVGRFAARHASTLGTAAVFVVLHYLVGKLWLVGALIAGIIKAAGVLVTCAVFTIETLRDVAMQRKIDALVNRFMPEFAVAKAR